MPNSKSNTKIEIWRQEVSRSTDQSTSSSPSGLRPRSPRLWKKLLGPREDKAKEVVKTRMYDIEPAGQTGKKGKGRGEGEVEWDGSSMDLQSEETKTGGLRERKERLERAARLLNRGGGNGKRDGEGDPH